MPKVYDLTGQVFGRLTAVEQAENSIQGHKQYRCRCECGKEIVVRGSELHNGRVKSCGRPGCKRHESRAKKDCFACVNRNGVLICTALTVMPCKYGECKFYAPVKKVCGECKKKNCDSCLIVSYFKQMEEKEEIL